MALEVLAGTREPREVAQRLPLEKNADESRVECCLAASLSGAPIHEHGQLVAGQMPTLVASAELDVAY
jgi:hypothetical protein